MTAEQYQRRSLDPSYGTTARPEPQPPEFAQQEFWQSRLRSLQQYICELLIENQRLRMSSTSMASWTDVELQSPVDIK